MAAWAKAERSCGRVPPKCLQTCGVSLCGELPGWLVNGAKPCPRDRGAAPEIQGHGGGKNRRRPPTKTCGQTERPSDGLRSSPRPGCPPPRKAAWPWACPGHLCLRSTEHRATAVPDKDKTLRTDFDILWVIYSRLFKSVSSPGKAPGYKQARQTANDEESGSSDHIRKRRELSASGRQHWCRTPKSVSPGSGGRLWVIAQGFPGGSASHQGGEWPPGERLPCAGRPYTREPTISHTPSHTARSRLVIPLHRGGNSRSGSIDLSVGFEFRQAGLDAEPQKSEFGIAMPLPSFRMTTVGWRACTELSVQERPA